MSTLLKRTVSLACSTSRTISSTAVSRKDLVQDLYIKELRGYKPAPRAKDAHVGAVKAYTLPPAPKPPTLAVDLAAQLSAYDAEEPTKAEPAKVSADASTEGGAEEFLELIERDIPKTAHH